MLKNMLKGKMFLTGFIILVIFIIIAIFAPIISPYDPYELGMPYQKPSIEHLLGTNDVGQDILSEMIYGTRISLFIGLVAAFIVTFIGTTLGLISGYFKGKIDSIVMSVTNVALVIPSLPLTIILVAYLNTSIWNIIIAICITGWAGTTRIIRSKVLQVREMPYIKIEKTLGASNIRIMFKHILPNISELVFIKGTLAVSSAMLTEASLSFLGLGVLGQKSWGTILHYAFFRSGVINEYYWWYLPPIICISLCVLGFTLLGYYNTSKDNSEKLIVSG